MGITTDYTNNNVMLTIGEGSTDFAFLDIESKVTFNGETKPTPVIKIVDNTDGSTGSIVIHKGGIAKVASFSGTILAQKTWDALLGA